MSELNLCPNCGKPNAEQNIFCQHCGSRLAEVEPGTSAAVGVGPTPTGSPSYPETIQTGGYPISSRQTSYFGTVQIDRLGTRLDGWADLVDGAADKAAMVENALASSLAELQFPDVNITRADLTPGGLAGKRRGYLLAQSYTGATMAVYISAFGRDLYLTWDMFVRPMIQLRNILIMLGVAGVLALFPNLDRFYFSAWFIDVLLTCIPVGIIALILGKVLRNSAWAFFIQEIDMFAADDITAMMFAVHHTLLISLDSVGIESELLRKKENYYAGRRGRII